jgi:succinate dehydrogenase flavin-adding protein (antitoxin of CptAB toxin-antitoxin module)
MRLIDELDDLYDSYVRAVNAAVEEDDLERAERLAAAYDEDALQLVAEREGKTHLLPLHRETPDTPLRRLVARLRTSRASRAA